MALCAAPIVNIVHEPDSITTSEILAATRFKAGLPDIHEHGLGGRLDRLVDYLNTQASLDSGGRQAAIATISDLLSRRARLLDDHDLHAAIGEEMIERPIIVTGLPRSGTTLLNMLIGLHPDNRIPRWWETTRPSPPPALAESDDRRLADADKEIEDLLRCDPSLLQSHPYFDEGGRAAAECEAFGALDLRVIRRTMYFRVPAFISLNLMEDPTDFYRFHKKILQQLQWRMPPRRWALKGVEHHIRLAALKAVYPDAIVVWLHRDPQKVFPSVFALNANLVQGALGHRLDLPQFGKKLLDMYGSMIDAAVASPLIDHPDVYHMQYADFATAPVAQIAALYRHYSLPFGDVAHLAMQEWLVSPRNKADRHGKFNYSLEPFGMSPQMLEERVAVYRRTFSIPFEGARSHGES